MMKYFLFVSMACALFSCAAAGDAAVAQERGMPFWADGMRDSVQRNDYRVVFQSEALRLTGVLAVKRVDGAWRGTLVNEWGVKVMDFISTPARCHLLNVMPMLDRWPVKRTLAADIGFIMQVDGAARKRAADVRRLQGSTVLATAFGRRGMLQLLAGGEVIFINYARRYVLCLKKLPVMAGSGVQSDALHQATDR